MFCRERERDGFHGFFSAWEGRRVSSVSDESSSSPGKQMSSSDGRQPCQSDTDSSVEESDFDTMPDIESDKNIIRTKVTSLCLAIPSRGQKVQESNTTSTMPQLPLYIYIYIFFFFLLGKSNFAGGFLDKA